MLRFILFISYAWVTLNVLALDDCVEETDCAGNSCDGQDVEDCQITCGYCDRSCLCVQVEGVDDLNGVYEWDASEVGWRNDSITLRYYSFPHVDLALVFMQPVNSERSWYREMETDVTMSRPWGGNFSNGDDSANIVINCDQCSLNPTTSEWLQRRFFIYIEPFSLSEAYDTETPTKDALNLNENDISDFQLLEWAPWSYWQDTSTCNPQVDCVHNFANISGTWGFRFELKIISSAVADFNYTVFGEGRDAFELAIAQNLESAGFPDRTVSMDPPSSVASMGLSKEKSTTIAVVTLIGLCLLAGFCYYFKCVRSKKELKFHQIEVGENNSRINWTRDGDTSDEDINYRSNSGQRISLADRKREEMWKNIVGTWVMGSRSWEVSNDGMGDYRVIKVGSDKYKTAYITEEGRFSIENGNYSAFFSNNKLIWSDGNTWVKRSIKNVPESQSESTDDGSSSSEEDEYEINCYVTKPDGERIVIVESVTAGILVSQLQRQLATKLAGISKNRLLIFARRNDEVPISCEWRLKDANIRNDEVFVVISQANVLRDDLQEAWDAFN